MTTNIFLNCSGGHLRRLRTRRSWWSNCIKWSPSAVQNFFRSKMVSEQVSFFSFLIASVKLLLLVWLVTKASLHEESTSRIIPFNFSKWPCFSAVVSFDIHHNVAKHGWTSILWLCSVRAYASRNDLEIVKVLVFQNLLVSSLVEEHVLTSISLTIFAQSTRQTFGVSDFFAGS